MERYSEANMAPRYNQAHRLGMIKEFERKFNEPKDEMFREIGNGLNPGETLESEFGFDLAQCYFSRMQEPDSRKSLPRVYGPYLLPVTEGLEYLLTQAMIEERTDNKKLMDGFAAFAYVIGPRRYKLCGGVMAGITTTPDGVADEQCVEQERLAVAEAFRTKHADLRTRVEGAIVAEIVEDKKRATITDASWYDYDAAKRLFLEFMNSSSNEQFLISRRHGSCFSVAVDILAKLLLQSISGMDKDEQIIQFLVALAYIAGPMGPKAIPSIMGKCGLKG